MTSQRLESEGSNPSGPIADNGGTTARLPELIWSSSIHWKHSAEMWGVFLCCILRLFVVIRKSMLYDNEKCIGGL